MSKVVDLTGKIFGRLTVIERAENDIRGKSRWKVLCDCGGTKIVPGNGLKRGTKSCGCLNREKAAIQINLNRPKVSPTSSHGGSCKPQLILIYQVYRGMLNRCYNTNQKSYKDYGALGVTVCDRWRGKKGFPNFLADMGERPEGTSLSRFGDIGNYEPINVSWHTRKEQAAEQRKKRLLQPQNKKLKAVHSVVTALPIFATQYLESYTGQ